jgi:PPOX class probable F420-dependent enzyme
MTDPIAFSALGDQAFVSLTTFRRSGEAVSTPVWLARDGDALIVTTPEESGKVKRLRNSGRVEMRPCTRMGKVADDAPVVAGSASIIADAPTRDRLTAVIRKKYGVEFHVITAIETIVAKRRKERVILRSTAA